jgi:hypothetical protein
MRLAKNPLEEGVGLAISYQDVEFKKNSDNPTYGS